MDCSIYRNVDQQENRAVDLVCKDSIEDNEEYIYCNDGYQYAANSRHPRPHKFVVDMVLVWKKRVSVFADPVEGYPHYIKQRDQQRGECHNDFPVVGHS